MEKTIIGNGLLLLHDKHDIVVKPGDLLIEGSRIKEIGDKETFEYSQENTTYIDAHKKLVTPGFVNAHTHSPQTLAKGGFDIADHPRFMWRNQADTARRTASEVETSAVLSAIEFISSGTTAIIDHFPEQNFEYRDIEAIVRAYTKAGLRVNIAFRVFDQEYRDIMPADFTALPEELRIAVEESPVRPKPYRETLDVCRRAIESFKGAGNGLIDFMIGPSAPLRCSDEFLKAIDDFSASHSIGVHTHLLESQLQQDIAQARYGETTVEHLRTLGLLDERLSCAHCIWMTDKEIELMSESGATVVHNPLSNLKLGSGIAPIPKVYESGGYIAFGTDGSSTNDGVNLLETMKYTALLHRCTGYPRNKWVPTDEIINMGTKYGARAMLRQNEIGTIAPGKKADLVLFDLNDPSFTPLNGPLNQLVYCADPRSVDTVMIDGKLVLKDGKMLTVDTDQVLEDARACMGQIRTRNEDLYRLVERIDAYL